MLTKVAVPHNEQVQILRYEKTQYYSAHLDNWDPAFYTTEGSEFIEHGHNNRLITVFWYLTNVSEGGETTFPRSDGLPQPPDMYKCDQGLKVVCRWECQWRSSLKFPALGFDSRRDDDSSFGVDQDVSQAHLSKPMPEGLMRSLYSLS